SPVTNYARTRFLPVRLAVVVALSLNVTLDVALTGRRLPKVIHEEVEGHGFPPKTSHMPIHVTDEVSDLLLTVDCERCRYSRSHRDAHFRGRPTGPMSPPRTPSTDSISDNSSRSAAV